MTPDERSLLQRFLSDLGDSRGVAKDAEADAMIGQAVRANPDAAYLLVQHALLADQALQAANQRLAELEQGGAGPNGGGFLGGGGAPAPGGYGQAEPYPPPAYPQQAYPQQGYPAQGYTQPPGAYAPSVAASPGPLSPQGGLGGFLRSAGTMAAGVAAGDFLAQGLENLFSPRGW